MHRSFLAAVAETPSCRHWAHHWGQVGHLRQLVAVDMGNMGDRLQRMVLAAEERTYVVVANVAAAAPLLQSKAHSYLRGCLTW